MDAAAWVAKQSAEKPFFLYFATHDPHIPLRPTKADLDYFTAKRERLKLTDEFKPDGASNVRQTQAHPRTPRSSSRGCRAASRFNQRSCKSSGTDRLDEERIGPGFARNGLAIVPLPSTEKN